MILSCQWGFLLIASIIVFAFLLVLVNKERGVSIRLFKTAMLALGVSFLVGSWFYFYLYTKEGRFTAFNHNSPGFSFSNKDLSFYRNTGLKNFRLFRTPIYGSFKNMFIPVFYSDIWGDYWGFYTSPNLTSYVLSIWDWDDGDYYKARSYLGRVNGFLFSPRYSWAWNLCLGCGNASSFCGGAVTVLFSTFIFVLAAVSLAGYLWFMISYPANNGDTIKATYMIHVFVMLAFLVAEFLEFLHSKSPRLFLACMTLSGPVVILNLPAMLTRYIYIP